LRGGGKLMQFNGWNGKLTGVCRRLTVYLVSVERCA